MGVVVGVPGRVPESIPAVAQRLTVDAQLVSDPGDRTPTMAGEPPRGPGRLTSYCLGYGEWTLTGIPSSLPPCLFTQIRAKIDLIFVREDRLAGDYSGDSLAIPTTCTGISATINYSAGSCSDHRPLVGTVTVTTG